MKKISLLLVCVFLCLIALATMSSCGNIKAAMTWSKVANKMNKLDSYEMDAKTSLVYYTDGKEISETTESHTIVDVSEDDFYYYSKNDVNVSAPELGIDQDFISVVAYKEGIYYLRNKSSGVDNRICGEMGVDDFNEFVITSFDLVNMSKCKQVTTKKLSNGSKSVTCSGYNDKGIEMLTEMLNIDTSIFEQRIIDCSVSLVYDNKNRIQTTSYVFRFEKSDDDAPNTKLSVFIQYSKYNEAERTDKYIKKDGYTEVDNIKLLNDISKHLSELYKKDKGSFKLNRTQTLEVGSTITTHNESDVIRYGTNKDGFYYTIFSTVNGVEKTLTYSKGDEDGEIKNDLQARSYVASLINSAGYSPVNVTNIIDRGNGVYEFECRIINPSVYRRYMTDNGIEYYNTTLKMTVTVYHEKIKKLESEIVIRGRRKYSYSSSITFVSDVTLTVKNECFFE